MVLAKNDIETHLFVGTKGHYLRTYHQMYTLNDMAAMSFHSEISGKVSD